MAEHGLFDLSKPGIRAYHGSPHDFNQFDLAKIGTGEGAQAYGHGLYFAEKPDVAEFYKKMNSEKPTLGGKPLLDQQYNTVHSTGNDYLDKMIRESFGDMDLTRKTLEANVQAGPTVSDLPFWQNVARERVSNSQSAIKHLDEIEKSGNLGTVSPGHMYEVNINAHPDQFLDWDKPLSEQATEVQKVLRPIAERYKSSSKILSELNVDELSGENLLRAVREQEVKNIPLHKVMFSSSVKNATGLPAAASESLQQAGIPGIKYLDQGSRDIGEGTSNYVVFDPKIIDILKKYGIAGFGAIPAGAGVLDTSVVPQQYPPPF